MSQLPPHLISHVDQAKTSVDHKVKRVVSELQEDLIDSDESYIWFALASTWVENSSPYELATALASAMLRLAQKGDG